MHLCAVNQLIERLTEDRRVASSRLSGVTVLFDLIIEVPVNNFFSCVGTGLPVLNQY